MEAFISKRISQAQNDTSQTVHPHLGATNVNLEELEGR